MAHSVPHGNALHDIGTNGDSAFDRYMATNSAPAGTPYKGVDMNASNLKSAIAGHVDANDASIGEPPPESWDRRAGADPIPPLYFVTCLVYFNAVVNATLSGHQIGRIGAATLAGKRTLVPGGPRPGLKLNVPSAAEPVLNDHHVYSTHSQSSSHEMGVGLDIPRGKYCPYFCYTVG